MAHSEATCRQVLAKVFLYLDGEIAGDACGEIDAHLRACADCLHHYGFERDFKALIARKCGQDPVPEDLRERLLSRLNQLLEG